MAKRTRRIVVIQGHPDPEGGHLGHGLAESYAHAAEAAGHEVRRIEVARLKFPWLKSADEFEKRKPPPDIARAQEALRWAQHIVIFFPLWLGTMPALLKAFLEQVFRPGFALDFGGSDRFPRRLLAGRSARIVVTMGMPGFIYRWYFSAHGLRGLEQSILEFSGVKPVRHTLIGMVGNPSPTRRAGWLAEMRRLGGTAG